MVYNFEPILHEAMSSAQLLGFGVKFLHVPSSTISFQNTQNQLQLMLFKCLVVSKTNKLSALLLWFCRRQKNFQHHQFHEEQIVQPASTYFDLCITFYCEGFFYCKTFLAARKSLILLRCVVQTTCASSWRFAKTMIWVANQIRILPQFGHGQ